MFGPGPEEQRASPLSLGSGASVELVTCGIARRIPDSPVPLFEWRAYLVQHGPRTIATRLPYDVDSGGTGGQTLTIAAAQAHPPFQGANPPIAFLKYEAWSDEGELGQETIFVWQLGAYPAQLASFGGQRANVAIKDGVAMLTACHMTPAELQRRKDIINSGRAGGPRPPECMDYPQRASAFWVDGVFELSVEPLDADGSGDQRSAGPG